jgi:hypothetical protein
MTVVATGASRLFEGSLVSTASIDLTIQGLWF